MEDENDVPKVPIDMLPPTSRPIYLHNRDGNLENARNYFLMDYCIASEQYPIAYELGKADLNTNGPSPLLLKQMVRICLALHKKEEARSHLNVLRTLPFEKDFIETYAPEAQELKKGGSSSLRAYSVRLTDKTSSADFSPLASAFRQIVPACPFSATIAVICPLNTGICGRPNGSRHTGLPLAPAL